MGARFIVQSRTRLGKRHRCAKMYASLVQDQGPKVCSRHSLQTFPLTSCNRTPLTPLKKPTPDQALLAKNYDENADRNPRGIFCTPTGASAAPVAGIVGPLGASSFSLPTVERALAEMEGYLWRCTGVGAPTSALPTFGSAPSPTQHEVLHNFFNLLNPEDRAASTGTSAVSPGAAASAGADASRKTGSRRSSGSVGAEVGIRRQIEKRNRRSVGCEGEGVS